MSDNTNNNIVSIDTAKSSKRSLDSILDKIDQFSLPPSHQPANSKSTVVFKHVDVSHVIIPNNVPVVNSTVIDDDTQHAREHLYGVLDKTAGSIDMLMEIVKETQSPRTFEVMGQLLKIQSDTAQQLLKLQKDRRDLNVDPKTSGVGTIITGNTTYVANAIFTGTNSQLLDLIQKNDDRDKIIEHEDDLQKS